MQIIASSSEQDFIRNDGGRVLHGFLKAVYDCFVRAVAIATEIDYWKIRYLVERFEDSIDDDGTRVASAQEVMYHLGWKWIEVDSSTRPADLPLGRLVVLVPEHACAVIDRVLHDTQGWFPAG